MRNEEVEEALKLGALSISFAPLGICLGVLLHESAHAGAALLMGEEITLFAPWPHSKGDRFLLGEVQVSRTLADRSPAENIFFYAGPTLINASMMVTSDILFRAEVVRRRSPEGIFLFISGLIIPWVGHTYQWIGGWTHEPWDWGRVGKQKGAIVPQVVGGMLVMYGLVTIIYHSHKFFRK